MQLFLLHLWRKSDYLPLTTAIIHINIMQITAKLKHGKLKKLLLWLMIHPVETRPRLWLRLFRPLYTQCAWSSVIHHSARMDVVPFQTFSLGKKSVVESYACVNNAVGAVRIGDHSRVGLHNTIIGPVRIGDHVNLAQGVVVSGLNHGFSDPEKRFDEQQVTTAEVVIEDDVWIGANSVILQGVHLGTHSVIAAGAVVTKDVQPYTVVAGNPAKVIRILK